LKEVLRREGISALAFIPLVAKGRVIGKFMTYFDAPHHFSSEELDLALTIGRQLGFGVERLRAEEALRQAQSELAQHAARLEQTVAERTQELRATNEQLEAFVYTIAHELRGPLRAM